MKTFLYSIFILVSYSCLQAAAQNCNAPSTGFPNLKDLGTGTWRGYRGGLYPNGSNVLPPAHFAAGLALAQNMMPLDTGGNLDAVNGKVVWLSIGMSNTTFETQFFIPMTDTFAQKNPKLVLVDGAQGGQDIVTIMNPNANFWSVINQRLAAKGLTNKQVQVIWFKQAEGYPSDTAFATYPDGLKLKYKTALQIAKDYFPNAIMAYLSNRIYAGYATSLLNPEPYAWYSGWSVKRLIEDQVNGDTSLTYTGIEPRVPWLAWGPELWADGTTPRSDGLTWICPDDYNSDGTHPSNPDGRQKVANLLFSFFSTDATATPWFLEQNTTGISQGADYEPFFTMHPNPANSFITLDFPGQDAEVTITDTRGRILLGRKNVFPPLRIDATQYQPGIYFIRLTADQASATRKLVVK
jgi:hypothetical protein